MKRFLTAISAAALLLAVGCSSPQPRQMTKLERELDAVISKYDTATWINIVDAGWEVIAPDGIDSASISRTDTLLNNALSDFCKTFFADVKNFDDLIFSRHNDMYSDVEDVDWAYELDSTQFIKYRVRAPFRIDDVPYEKMSIKGGRVYKLLPLLGDGDYGVAVFLERGQIEVYLPYLVLKLKDAEFEKL